MSMGRAVSTLLATITVAACAVVVIGMARAVGSTDHAAPAPVARLSSTATSSSVPSLPPGPPSPPAGPTSDVRLAPVVVAPPSHSRSAATTVTSSASASASASARTSTAAPSHAAGSTHASTHPTSAPKPPPAHHSSAPAPHPSTRPHKPAPRRGVALPLRYSTGSATRVITVVASSAYSTTATLQAWTKAPGGGWLRWGRGVTAHVGADGLSTAPSESRSATPIGSFSLTHAFGHYSNPGTALPYVHTTSADWWISQYAGRYSRIYNTLQHCWSSCPFNQGAPNEHLYYETPYYNYAVVIDYNTPNAGPVRQGGGSAFFLHVTDYRPTAGCVAIPQANLVPIMRWLTPSARPRILIGVT